MSETPCGRCRGNAMRDSILGGMYGFGILGAVVGGPIGAIVGMVAGGCAAYALEARRAAQQGGQGE